MDTEERPWQKDLRADLLVIAKQFTADRYPADIDTQHTYQHALFLMEQSYDERLSQVFAECRADFDREFRADGLGKLDAAERELHARSNNREDHLALRAGQEGDRKALNPEHGTYRESQAYRDGMQALVERLADDREAMTRAFQQVEDALNERFGFERIYEHEREEDRHSRSR